MSPELVVLVGIVLLAGVLSLGIAAWREVRFAHAKRPTGINALFGALPDEEKETHHG